MAKASAFTLRLNPSLHAACEHYAAAANQSLQVWIHKQLEKTVGNDAIVVAAYAELSGKTPFSWPELP